MGTALQQQLAAIHATRSSELDLKAQKASHAQSLLFDPALASTQTFEVLFPLCRAGFLELCAVDPRFTSYSSTLFSSSSTTQDRKVLSKAQNKDLDKHLNRFLCLVSAFVLLKPAQKAIEWLVRRFKVHQLNTESLFLAFLPYHKDALFVTLLSILPAKFPPSLKDFQRYANSASNPPLSVLVDSAARNQAFLLLINRYALRMARLGCHYPSLVTLWASVITQTVDRLASASKSAQGRIQRQRHEDLLATILPTLNEALSLKHVPEMIVACHLTIVILVRKTELESRVLDALLLALSQRLTLETNESGLACISLVASQRKGRMLPVSVWKSVIQAHGLNLYLKSTSIHQDVRCLAMGLVLGFIKRMGSETIPNGVELVRMVLCSHILLDSERVLLLSAFKAALREDITAAKTSKTDVQRQLQDVERIVKEAMNLKNINPETPMQDSTQQILEMKAGANGEIGSFENDAKESFDNLRELLSDGGVDVSQCLANLSNESYLNSFTELPFDLLARSFESIVHSRQMTEAFLNNPFLDRRSEQSTVLFFSFLAKIWCSSDSEMARARALEALSDQIVHSTQIPLDVLQFMTPYILIGLADKAMKVRHNAAAAVLTLARVETKSTGATPERILFYGTRTAEVKLLSHDDLSEFIRLCLEPELEECISDARHVGRILRSAIGDRSSSELRSMRRSLKKSQRLAIFSSLSSHALLTNCASARLGLLKLLNMVNKISGRERSQYLLPCLRDYVAHVSESSAMYAREGINVVALRSELFKTIHPSDQDALQYLFNLATDDLETSKDDVQIPAFQRMYSLWPRLRRSNQKSLSLDLFHLTQFSNAPGYSATEASKFLKSMRVPTEVLTYLIDEMLDCQSTAQQESPAKIRRSKTGKDIVETSDGLLNGAYLSKLTFLMEIAENTGGRANVDLLQTLFRVLEEMQVYRMRANSDLSYLTEVLLSALSDTLRALNNEHKAETITPQTIRPDLLADCIRQTNSPQTRNSALTLLSDLARQFPQKVLHSVMPIFTMMSATTTRISDDFSANVVDQTIRHVVPVVVNKFHEQKKDLVAATAEILLSFAISFDHIPPHRRIQMYSLLARSLGSRDSLFAIIVTLSDRFEANADVLKFVTALFRQFTSVVCLTTIRKILELAVDGLDPLSSRFRMLIKQDTDSGSSDRSCVNLIRTAIALTKDINFQTELQKQLSLEENRPNELEQSLQNNFAIAVRLSSHSSEDFKNTAMFLMDQLLAVLSLEVMITYLETFMANSSDAVRICLLVNLENKLTRNKKSGSRAALISLSLLRHLTSVLESSSEQKLKIRALACIDLVCERFGNADRPATLAAIRIVSNKLCLGSDDITVQTLAFHCLASAVPTLENDFIPLLESTESAATSTWRTAISNCDESLHNAVIAFSISLFDNLSFVVSETFLRTALELASESAVANFSQDAYDNRIQIYKLVGSKIALPLIARVIRSTWQHTVMYGPLAVRESIVMVETLAGSRKRSEITRHNRDVFALFHDVLNLRLLSAASSELYSTQYIDECELQIIKALTSVVLKVNDAKFRPFFVRLTDWSSSPAEQGQEASTLRNITFFNLVFALSSQLKSLFTGYFEFVSNHASQVLSNRRSPVSAKWSVLRALSNSFEHDQDDFWQVPSRFSIMLKSLISCLSDDGMQLLGTQLSVAIIELAGAANSAEHLKTLNEELLKLCRSPQSQLKLAVVNLQQRLTQKLGDEWLSNLPEMLPVINELQEDDNEDVEEETRRWIKVIENSLGQSLYPMLQ